MKKNLFILASLSLVMFSCSSKDDMEIPATPENNSAEKVAKLTRNAEDWDFPIKPGTAEWNAVIDRQERGKLCQVPEELLPYMTTQKLAELWYEFPHWSDFAFVGENLIQGMDFIVKDFNGARELLKRDDSSQPLLVKLETLVKASSSYTQLLKNQVYADTLTVGDGLWRMDYVTVMLSRDEVINKASEENLRKIVNIGCTTLAQRINEPEVYSTPLLFSYLSYMVCKAGTKLSPEKRDDVAFFLDNSTDYFRKFDMTIVDKVQKLFQ